jgi:tetratricopeptide (TPR) repeat protein
LTKPLSILCNLLAQLLDNVHLSAYHPAILADIEPVFDKYPNRSNISLDLLWKTFNAVVTVVGPLYIVIDGLDECDNDQGDLEYLVDQLQELGETSDARVRILITSRTGYSGSSQRSKWVTTQIHSNDVEEDILLAIGDMIDTEPKLQGLQREILDAVTAHAGGMFLWAKIFLESLKIASTRNLMLEKLENPPIGLDKLYIDILTHMDEKLTSDQRLLRQSVFAWVTGALEPLKLEELSTALSVRYGEYSLNEDHVLIEPKNEIIRVCGPLVQFMDDKSLQLVHKSFRDFIKGTNWDESWNFLPKSQASKHGTSTLNDNFINETIAVTCLSYLSLACFKNLWVHANDTESWSTTYPLLPYAAEYWITHITKVTEPRDRLVEMVTTYCSSSGIVDWFYILDSSPKSSAEDLDDSERVLYDWLSKFTLDAEKSLKPDFNSDAHWTAVNALGSGESIDPVFKIGLYAQLAWLFVLRNRWNEGGKVAQAYARTKDGNMIQKPLLRQRSYHNEIIAQPSEDSKDGNLPTVSESLQWLDLLFSKHLELVKEDFGDEHWLNVLTVNRICRIYASQGRMRKARNILGPFWNLAATDPRFEDPDKLHRWASLLTLYFPHHTDDQAFGPGLEIWKRMQKLYGRNNRDTLRYGWHLANGLLEAGNVSSGLPMLESITKGLTESLGEENRETLNCKSRLASIYASRGQFVNAERLSMAVYETQQRLLGVYHKDTVCTALRRAKLYLFEERVAAAEPMLKDVAEYLRQVENHDSEIFLEYHLLASFLEETKGNLDGSERSLERGVRECTSVCGDIHPVTLIVRWVLIALRARNGSSENIEHINDYLILLERANQSDLHFYVEAQRLLARVYMKQGRFEDAEKVLNLQLERLKSHDAQNTGLVSVYCDLSMVYKSQSRFQDAEATLLMAIEQSTRRSNDIDMLQRGLAEVYESMGRLEDAQIQTSRAWQFCKSEFGISHSGTILAASQLARLLQLNGDEAAAKELWTEIWTCRDPSRTKSSTTIRNAAGSLISQYETKEQYDEACEIGYQLWDYITTMSESSNNTALIKLRSAYKLGRLSRLAGRLDDGETLLKQAWPGLQQELGQENPESLQAGSELSQVFVALGRFKDGDELAREILSIQETALGNTNADTMISYENLATWNSERGLIDEAIVFQRKLLDSCTGGDGEYAYALDPLRSKFRLAKLYQEQPGSTQQALEMMEEVYTDLKDHFGETNEDTLTTACNIADLLLGMEGEGPKCLRYAEISYEGRKLVYGPVNENTVLSELYVGMALEHNNELQKSISLIQEFLDNAKQQLPPYQKYELRAFLALSVAYSHDDREEDAKTLIEECFTLCKQASKSYILDAIPDITHLGVQLAALDMFEPAMEMFTLIFNTYIEDSAEIPSSSARVDAQIISDVLVNIPYWKGLAELWASSGTTALSTLWCTCTRQKMETLLESKPLVGLAVLRDLFRCNDAADTDRIAAFTQALGLDFLASLVERTLDNPEIRESETRDVRKSIGGLAFSLYGVGLYASAEKAYTQTLELAKKTLGESHNDTLMALRNLGKCLMLQQKWEECTQRNSELLYLRDTIPDTADKDLMEIISDLASALAILGKFDQTTVFQRNYDMSVNIYGQRDGTTRDAAGMLINSLFSTEQYKPAYEICSMMLDSEKNLVDKVDNAVVLWMSWLCLLSHFVEESDKPDEIFQKTLTVVRQVGVNRVGLQLYPFILRAKVLEMTGRIDEAVDMLTEVLSLGELDDGAEVDTEIEAFALQIWKDELEKYRQLKEQRSRGVFQRIAQMDCDPSAVLKSPLTPLALAAASVVAIIYIRRWTQQQ